jgi:hypothetical protein
MKSSFGYTSLEIIREQPNPHNFQPRPPDHIIITTMMKLTARVVISFSLFMALTLQVATASGALTSSPIEQQHNLEESGTAGKSSDVQEIIQVKNVESRQLRGGKERPQYITSGSPPDGIMPSVNRTDGAMPIINGTMPVVNGTLVNISSVNETYDTMSAVKSNNGIMTAITPLDVSYVDYNSIVSRLNYKCIDAGDKKKGNGLFMYDCLGWNNGIYYGNQKFKRVWRQQSIYLPFAAFPKPCIDVFGGNLVQGAKVGLWDCVNNAVNQKWYYTIYEELKPSLNLNLCLDIQWSNTNNGAILQLWTCNGSKAQKWIAIK